MLDLPQEVFRRRQNTVVSESGAKMERGLLSVVWEGLLPFVPSWSKSFKIFYHIHKRQITCVISSVFWVVLTIDPNFLQLFSFLHFFSCQPFNASETALGQTVDASVPMDVPLVWLACAPHLSSGLSHSPISSPQCVSVTQYKGALALTRTLSDKSSPLPKSR